MLARFRAAVAAAAFACFAFAAPEVDAEVVQVDPDGLAAVLAAEEGNIVVLNLWATWCAPCLVEIPDLITMEDNLADKNVKLIGLSVDEPRGSTAFIASMRDKRFPGFLTYARARGDQDELVSVVDPAWNEVVPTTYVIGRDGAVKTRIQGKKSLEEFTAAVLAVAD